jgi:8-oxo-dGTP pyrophosphatase MutT (NUDIX family)
MDWIPHVTVAAIIEKDGKFLMVKEKSGNSVVLNQPAGHWEDNESLLDAVIREILEETAYDFTPEGLVGCYQWKLARKNTTYLRMCFYGSVSNFHQERKLDDGIISADWYPLEHISNNPGQLRSPLVLACIRDYRNAKRYPLDFLHVVNESG